MKRRSVHLALLTAGVLVTALLVAPGQAAAHRGAQTGHTTIEVVAEGLDTPRGVFYDEGESRVLVAEAGQVAGNDGPCAAGANSQIWCVGRTGAIFEYSEKDHSGHRIATGLASIRTGDGTVPPSVLGVHDLVMRKGELTVIYGLSGRDTFKALLGPDGADLATIGIIDKHGNYEPYADLIAFEMAQNPDGRRFDSDAFGLAVTKSGTYVADAGGNTILKTSQNGTIELIVSPPPRILGTDPDYESVPTAVLEGHDGSFYIGELTGFPYHPGTARVLRFVPGFHAPKGQPLEEFAVGFTNIIDLAWDHKGRMIVLEIAKNGLFLPQDTVTGRLVRIECDGTQTELASTGLENPGAVAVAGPNEFYVTNRTTSAGDVGQLLRIRTHGYNSPLRRLTTDRTAQSARS